MHVTAGGNIGYPHIDSDPISVTPGMEYLFSAWVLQDAGEPLASGNSAIYKASWGNAFTGVINQTTVITSSSPMDQYSQGIFYGKDPSQYNTVVLQLLINAPYYSLTSGAYFDDIGMVPLPYASLTAGTGNGLGEPNQGSVTVTGRNGSYSSTIFNGGGNGETNGSINVLGNLPTPSTDSPVDVLISLDGSISDIANALSEIPGNDAQSVTVLTAGNPTFDELAAAYGDSGIDWTAVLQFNTPAGAAPGNLQFTWDFTGSNVTLADAVVVPEPATISVIVAASGYVLLKRKRP